MTQLDGKLSTGVSLESRRGQAPTHFTFTSPLPLYSSAQSASLTSIIALNPPLKHLLSEIMQGIVDKIWENETRDKKRYHVLEIGGEKYSVWDPNLLEGLGEGNQVEYEWKQSGNFKKITDLKLIDPASESGSYKSDRKSREIVRMSCLRSASEILHGLFIDPDEKTRKALDIAREFEKYVRTEEEGRD